MISLCALGCVTANEYYHLLDSIPYTSYTSDQNAPLPDEPIGFSVKGATSILRADPDTSLSLPMLGGSLHMNISRAFGLSFNGNSIFKTNHYFFGSIEARYWMNKKNIYFVPVIGFSIGSGSVGPTGDLRCTPSLILRLKGSSYWFLAPRIALFTYPSRIETGIVPIIDYETATIMSINSGFNIKIWSIGSPNNDHKIMLAPEISFSITRDRGTGSNISLISFVIYLSFLL